MIEIDRKKEWRWVGLVLLAVVALGMVYYRRMSNNMAENQSAKPRVYVINLLKRSDQKAEYTKNNGSFLDVHFVEAVDGHTAGPSKQAKPGRYGCFLSHLKAWQMVAVGDQEWAMVGEDDFKVNPKFVEWYRDLIQKATEKGADFVYLDNTQMREDRFSSKVDVKPLSEMLYGMQLYMISRAVRGGCSATQVSTQQGKR